MGPDPNQETFFADFVLERGAPNACSGKSCWGLEGTTGLQGNFPKLRTLSYMMIAPAVATLMQNLVGIFTTRSHFSSISGDNMPRSGPRT